MFKDLIGKRCKIILDSLGNFVDGYNVPLIFGAEILAAGENFIKVRTLDKVKSKTRIPTIVTEFPVYYDEDEEVYLNIKNILSITPL